MKTLEGNLVSKGIKIGIVAARFNEFITSKLLGGARDGLLRHRSLPFQLTLKHQHLLQMMMVDLLW